MTDDELIEKVARASYDRWRRRRPNAPAFDDLVGDALESELEDAASAVAAAFEAAARIAEQFERYTLIGFDGTTTYHTGCGHVVAEAIRRRIPTRVGRDHET